MTVTLACEDYKPQGKAAGTLVCLPGVNSGPYLLEGALEALPDWRIVRVIPPGVDGAEMIFPFSITAYAAYVLELIGRLDVEGDVVVLGHSLGGYAAQELVRLAPNKIARLVLVSTGRGQPDTTLDMAVFSRKTELSFWELNMLVGKDAAKGMAKLFGRGFAEREPEVFNFFIAQRGKHLPSKEVSLAQLSAGASFSSMYWINKIKIPTLVVHGSEDALVSSRSGKKLATSLPGGKWLEYYGVGHFPMLEHPRFWRDVAAFAREGEGGVEVNPSTGFISRLWERWHVRG